MKIDGYKYILVDNSLIRAITKKNNGDLYNNFINSLSTAGAFNNDSKLYFTPSGIIEFLGYGKFQKNIATNELKTKIEPELKKSIESKNFNEILKLHDKLVSEILSQIYKSKEFDKKTLFKKLENQKKYTNNELYQLVISNIRKLIKSKVGRKNLRYKLALDRSETYDWSSDIKDYIHSLYLARLVHSVEKKYSVSSVRGISKLGESFKNKKIKEFNIDKKVGSLSKQEYIKNLDEILRLSNLKKREDFLDSELIHISLVGFMDKSKNEKALISTSDSVEQILVRIALYKYFYIQGYNFSKEEDIELNETLKQGIIIIFDNNLLISNDIKISYIIEVEKVDPIHDISCSVKINNWIEEKKILFKSQ